MAHHSFRIVWSNPAGRFGWVTVSDCDLLDHAIDEFDRLRSAGLEVPPDAQLDQISQLT